MTALQPAAFVFVLHVAATLPLAGMMGFVQLAHYPLFPLVRRDAFARYSRGYSRLALLAALPLMLVETGTGLALLSVRPDGVSAAQAGLGAALLVVVWLSTVFLQWPRHYELASGFDARAHARLLRTNWIRTAAYGLRASLVLAMLAGALRPAGR